MRRRRRASAVSQAAVERNALLLTYMTKDGGARFLLERVSSRCFVSGFNEIRRQDSGLLVASGLLSSGSSGGNDAVHSAE
jgi:hypothetical protein